MYRRDDDGTEHYIQTHQAGTRFKRALNFSHRTLRAIQRHIPVALAIAFTLAASLPVVSQAQETYPTRPVRFVVPFPPGSQLDFVTRLAAQKLMQTWGVPVIVEVRDGASGTIGVNQVVKSAPDGYTLLFTSELPIVIAPVVSKTPYDPRKDLAPIAAVAQNVYVLIAHPSIRAASVKEMIAAAKAQPGTLTVASSGEGSASHLCIELIKQAAGIDLVEIPYRGAGPSVQAVLAGDVSMYCSPIFPALPHIKSGKLRALGVAATTPSAVIPDVLPFPAQGLPDVIISTWEGAFAPSGTPQPVLDKVRDSLKELFADAEVREKVAATGLDLIWMDTPAFTEAIRSDLEKWTRVVQKTRKTQ